jgi:hypothetical protein
MSEHQLTPYEEEIVEQELHDFFVFSRDEIAAELGLARKPEDDWSDEDVECVVAEIDKRYRSLITDRFSSPTTA